jgi:RNA polymerase sigma-70 factor (ECF subfamily)
MRDPVTAGQSASPNIDFAVGTPNAYTRRMGTIINLSNGAAAGGSKEAGTCHQRIDPMQVQDRHLANLMQSAQDGDSAAYAQLLGELTPLLRRTVRRRHGFLPPQEVEDIIQEILLSLPTARATYDPGHLFFPWLMAIARNRTADALRRRIRRSTHEIAVEQYDVTFPSADTNSPVDVYRDPEALRQAIGRLPQGQRKAVEMLKLREMSLKEAAAATGMSISALKVAVHRAMKSLHAALSHEI